MKFRVLGHRKSDAHRITLEFEAESKAAAERDAIKQGLEVIRVELVPAEGDSKNPAVTQPAVGRVREQPPTPTPSRGTPRILILLLILIVALAAAYYSWDTIKQSIPGLH